jgi:hypothetical protein
VIKFNVQDITTPGGQMDDADTWAVIETADPADMKARLKAIQPYGQFLCTPYWRAVANKVKDRDGRRCKTCESVDRLEAHHPPKTYSIHGEEHLHMGRLITLCHSCHSKFHGKEERPTSAYSVSPKAKKKKKKRDWAAWNRNRRIESEHMEATRLAKIRANEAHKDLQKTVAADNHLSMDDLIMHASIHRNFNYRRLANWLDSVPMRWNAYRDVAAANRAMKGGR